MIRIINRRGLQTSLGDKQIYIAEEIDWFRCAPITTFSHEIKIHDDDDNTVVGNKFSVAFFVWIY